MKLIAEFCQNHNGDFGLLKEMIYAAKDVGCEYAKIQTIFANMLSKRERFEKGIIINDITKSIKRPFKLEYDRLKKLELSEDQQAEFISICKKVGIKPLTTIFTKDSIQLIKRVGFEDIKVASYDCGSIPLLNLIKSEFNKIFISTGATFDSEIEEAYHCLKNNDFTFFHCVTKYPTPLADFNLDRMNYLRKYCKEVGWSDHSLVSRDGILGTCAAVYYGADWIERHFTILPADKTKDGPVSINIEQSKELISFSKLSNSDQKLYLDENFKNHNITLGQQTRELTNEELLNRDYYRGRFCSNSLKNLIYNWE
tara:strand:- start:666 stop:1601 length:936 start_codon:yes stop_codon:yes gene_type:complete